jgi:hypothetical protein
MERGSSKHGPAHDEAMLHGARTWFRARGSCLCEGLCPARASGERSERARVGWARREESEERATLLT